jgi:hypothetical protein
MCAQGGRGGTSYCSTTTGPYCCFTAGISALQHSVIAAEWYAITDQEQDRAVPSRLGEISTNEVVSPVFLLWVTMALIVHVLNTYMWLFLRDSLAAKALW